MSHCYLASVAFISVSNCLSVYSSVCLSATFCLSICQPARLSVRLLVCLFICLFSFRFYCLSFSLSFMLSTCLPCVQYVCISFSISLLSSLFSLLSSHNSDLVVFYETLICEFTVIQLKAIQLLMKHFFLDLVTQACRKLWAHLWLPRKMFAHCET